MSMIEVELKTHTEEGYVKPDSMILRMFQKRLLFSSFEDYRIQECSYIEGGVKLLILSEKSPDKTDIKNDAESCAAGLNLEYEITRINAL